MDKIGGLFSSTRMILVSARDYHQEALKYEEQGNLNRAQASYLQALDIGQKAHQINSAKSQVNRTLAKINLDYGRLLEKLNRFPEAKDTYQQAQEYANEAHKLEPNHPKVQDLSREVEFQYSQILRAQGQTAQADKVLERVVPVLQQSPDSNRSGIAEYFSASSGWVPSKLDSTHGSGSPSYLINNPAFEAHQPNFSPYSPPFSIQAGNTEGKIVVQNCQGTINTPVQGKNNTVNVHYYPPNSEASRPPAVSLDSLRNALYQHYQLSNLSIQRVSGQTVSLDDCYINLAIVESRAQREKDKKELEKQAANFERLPSSEQLEATNPNKLITLEQLFFEKQKLRDGSENVPRRILIQGRAGIGKTTLCKKLVHEYYHNGLWQNLFDNVLWVPLRQLKTASFQHLEELLCNRYFSNHGSAKAQALGKAFFEHQGKTLFILDGLDEVTEMFDQHHRLNHFLTTLLNQSHVLITSRPAGVNASQCNDLDLELETIGFSPNNVQAYIQKFTPALNQAAIQQFINRTPLIQGLVNIPIQLDALCYSWDRLPQNQEVTMSLLYEAMVDKLWRKDGVRLEKQDKNKKVLSSNIIQISSKAKLEKLMEDEIHYLGYLAFKGLNEGKIEFNAEELDQCQAELEDKFSRKEFSFSFTDDLKKTSFLHTADAQRPEAERQYHFLHLTFQEFFAAKFLARHLQAYTKAERASTHIMQKDLGVMPQRNELEAFIATYKYNPRYEIVWWMVAGLLKGAALENFFHVLGQSPRDLIGTRHQQVTLGCLNEARAQLEATTRTQLEKESMQWLDFEIENGKSNDSRLGSQRVFPERLLLESLSQTRGKKKNKVLATLGARPTLSVDALQALISSLKDENGSVRDAAIGALGRQRSLSADAVQALISSLKDDDELAKYEITKALDGQNKLQDDAVQVLVSYLKDENWEVRSAAADVLDIQDTLSDEAVQVLISYLKDKDKEVREAAASTLGSQNALSDDVVQVLSSSLKDENGSVREAAARALGRQSTLSDDAVQVLISSLRDENGSVREAAAKALGNQSTLSGDTVQVLISSLKDKNWDIRYAAARAFGTQSMLSDNAVQVLISYLKDEGKEVREAAARALGNQSTLSDGAVQVLISYLKNKDEEVREAAARALGSQNTLSDDAVQALISSLKDENGSVRVTAARALGRQSTLSGDAVQVLIPFLKDENGSVREAAVEALGNQSTLSGDAIQVLISSLKDKNGSVREAAAKALGNQSTLSDDAAQVLISSLKDKNWGVREAAARALGNQSTLSDDAVQVLISYLKNKDEEVREAAARALGRQSSLSDDAAQVLISSLKDKNWEVRYAAARALGSQSSLSDDAVRVLISYLKDKDKEAREAAARALGDQSSLSDDAVRVLISYLKDKDKEVRYAAARALGRQSSLSDDAVQVLISYLKNKDEEVREMAASALCRQSTLSADAVQVLISSLKDENWSAREAVANTLGSQSTLSDDAVQTLVSYLKDEHWYIRDTAARALGSHMNQLFILLARLERNQIEELYTQVLFPRSCRQIALLYIQDQQLHFYTATGPGQPIDLTTEQSAVIIKALSSVRAEAGIAPFPEEEPFLIEE